MIGNTCKQMSTHLTKVMTCKFPLLSFLISLAYSQCLASSSFLKLSMPHVRPEADDFYLCTAKRLNSESEQFIVGFNPNASATKVHHILVYGCKMPGKVLRDTPRYTWSCGEMGRTGKFDEDSAYEVGPVCGSGRSNILFAWALDAPAIELPEGVGFKIGGDSGIDYLVLQVHYGHTHIFKENPEERDDSGIEFQIVSGSDHSIKKRAGIHLLLSYGYVEEGVTEHHIECKLKSDIIMHPFRFRTHTHKLGTLVAGYTTSHKYPYEKVLIGQHDPQEAQMFYPVEGEPLTIEPGDTLSAFCRFNNTRGKNVYIGATGNDEMCNFYMMYWTESQTLPTNQDCLQYNPPSMFFY